MKKLILLSVSVFLALPLAAEEYSITTVMSHPFGIFDTLTTGGDVKLANAEIGVRDWGFGASGITSYPIMQKQTLKVTGLSTITSTTGFTYVDGSLQLELPTSAAAATQFNLNSVYVQPNRYFTVAGEVLITNLYTGAINTFGNFIYTPTAVNTLSYTGAYAWVHHAIHADRLAFQHYNIPGKILVLPDRHFTGGANYADGEAMTWKAVKNSTSIYGPWVGGDIAGGDTCDGNMTNEYTCTASKTEDCTDVRILDDDEYTYYQSRNGVYIWRTLGRKECRYINTSANPDTCKMDSSYRFDIFTPFDTVENIPDCPAGFNTATFNLYYGSYDIPEDINRSRASICNMSSLCPNGICTETVSCKIADSGTHGGRSGEASITSFDPVGAQHGVTVANCARTGWPSGTGLECKNAWEEKWFTVITCGPGTGKQGHGGKRRQHRNVSCKENDTSAASTGVYFMLDK